MASIPITSWQTDGEKVETVSDFIFLGIKINADGSVDTVYLGAAPLGWTGWISLQSKGLSRVFSSTTVQKHQFFST